MFALSLCRVQAAEEAAAAKARERPALQGLTAAAEAAEDAEAEAAASAFALKLYAEKD